MNDSTTAASLLGFLRAHLKWLIALAALLMLYALAGFWLVPKLARNAAIDYVHNELHRELAIGELRFNPFTLTAVMRKVQLKEADGSLMLGFDELRVNAEFRSLLHTGYVFKEIRLAAPTINAILLKEGQLNLAALAGEKEAAEASASSSALPDIRIGHFELLQGQLRFEDRTRPQIFAATLKPIEFTLENFRTEPQYDNAFHFSARSAAGETLDWRGDFALGEQGSVNATGQLQVGELQAATIQSYLQDTLPFQLQSGRVSLAGTYRVDVKEQLEAQLDLSRIQLADARVAPKEGGEPWVTLPQLELQQTQVALHERSVKIGALNAGNAQLKVWLDAERNLNLLQLLGPETPPSDAPWKIEVANIAFTDTQVEAEDRAVTPAAQFKLNPVQLSVAHYSSAPGSSIDLDGALRINEAGDVTLKGSVALDTLEAKLKLGIQSLALTSLQPYIAASTDMIVNSGTVDADGELYYRGTAKNKEPELRFSGDATVSKFASQDAPTQQDFIKWQTLKLNGLKYSMAPDELIVREVRVDQPYGRVDIDANGITNVARVLRTVDESTPTKGGEAPASTVPADSAPPMRTRIARVIIERGYAAFSDHTVSPRFATDIRNLRGNITGLSSANDSRSKVSLSGNVDNHAPMSLEGEANLLAATTFLDVAMKFSNMELTTFNPYSGKFAGYAIAKGKLSTEIRYRVRERQLDAQHHIVLDQLEFGEAIDSKEAVSLPVKLAVALLKDRHGVIDLDLPVGGSLDDPSFKIGPLIWKVCVNLLTKVVTAPFSALGALFGGGDELAYVDFSPGTAALSEAEKQKLSTLAKALVERPQLKLNIPLTVVTDVDAAVLNRQAFDRALAVALPQGAAATPKQRLDGLTKLYQQKAGAAPTFPEPTDPKADVTLERIQYLENSLPPYFAIGVDERNVLTRERADAVQALILANTEVAAERVFLTARSNEVESPQGVSRMELKLE